MGQPLILGSPPKTNGLGQILKRTAKLMADNGYHGTSMRDLARATDRSLSGLYHYFKTKEELLYLINHHGFTRLLRGYRRWNAVVIDPLERLYCFIFYHVTFFTRHLEEMRVMVFTPSALSGERGEAIRRLKRLYTRRARALVRDLPGLSAQLSPRRLNRLVFLLFGMLNWIHSWYTPKRGGGRRQVATEIFRLFIGGLPLAVNAHPIAPPSPGRIQWIETRAREISAGQRGGK